MPRWIWERPKKGKNFSAEEERGLCRSFLAVSQDPICGNGQRNTAFWERITTYYNQTKAKGSPVRPTRSLETKWGNIKHDVWKFCGCYKQVLDCREFGTSGEDVLQRALEYYKDRHSKQHGFTFLHCWQILKDVPHWWDSPVDVQRRSNTGETSPGIDARGSRRPVPSEQMPTTGNAEATAEGDGSGDDQVQVISSETFRVRPVRPQGNKSAKNDVIEASRRETILKSQARAVEQMAVSNMQKAQVMEDQVAISLFRLPIGDDLDEEAREYFKLRRKQKMERIKRRMDVERRTTELEEAEHQRLIASQVRMKRSRLQADPTILTEPVQETAVSDPAAVDSPTHQPSAPLNSSPPLNVTTVTEDDETWENSQCIPDTQPLFDAPVIRGQIPQTRNVAFAPVPSTFGSTPNSAVSVDPNQNAFHAAQMFAYRNFGQGLNLNARFYSQ